MNKTTRPDLLPFGYIGSYDIDTIMAIRKEADEMITANKIRPRDLKQMVYKEICEQHGTKFHKF